MRAVGHGQHEIGELRVQFRDALVGQLDFFRDLLHFRQQGGDVFPGFFSARDFLAGFVALGFQSLRGGNSFAALLIDRAKAVEIDGDAAIGRHLFKFSEVFAKISQVMHAG